MQFKNQSFGEAFATPLDSREKANFEALGGPRSWIEGSSFGADADTAAADLVVAERGTGKSTAPPEIRLEVVSAPQGPSLRSQYAIGLLGVCLAFAPMLEALGTHINFGLPLRIGGIFAVGRPAARWQILAGFRRRCNFRAPCAAARSAGSSGHGFQPPSGPEAWSSGPRNRDCVIANRNRG